MLIANWVIGDYQAKAFLLQSTEPSSTAKLFQVQEELITQNLQCIITNWDLYNQERQAFL